MGEREMIEKNKHRKTGVCDKNNEMIYEGNIVKFNIRIEICKNCEQITFKTLDLEDTSINSSKGQTKVIFRNGCFCLDKVYGYPRFVDNNPNTNGGCFAKVGLGFYTPCFYDMDLSECEIVKSVKEK